MLWSARMPPLIWPVSCCGKKPLGAAANRYTFRPTTKTRIVITSAALDKAQSRQCSYTFSMRSKPRSKQRATKPGFLCCGPLFSSQAHIIGVVVSEMTSEIITAADRVTANSRNSRPTWPPMNSSGMKTATSDRLIDSTVKPTSRAPSRAALKRSMPASMWRCVFSSTTMASSTTKPVATVSAIKERLFRQKPSMYITPKVPSSETMVATAGMMVARTLRRKALTTSTTSTMDRIKVNSISCSEERMELVLSDATCSLMSPGSCACSCGSSARTPSTVAMTLAPGWRVISTMTAGSPLNRPRVLLFSTPSTTSATSSRRMAAPSRQATTRLR